MKGKIHTDELMEPVVNKETGLLTGRRMSHVFYVEALIISNLYFSLMPQLIFGLIYMKKKISPKMQLICFVH